jgi:hypothetical protein
MTTTRHRTRFCALIAGLLLSVGCDDSLGPLDSGATHDATTRDAVLPDLVAGDGSADPVPCDPAKVTCKSLPATPCGIGEVHSIRHDCWGPCVPVERCRDLPAQPNCDLSGVSCEMVTPSCQQGYVPTAEGTCYGPCVPIGACACTSGGPAGQCPGDAFVCHNNAGRCGPLD